jgi:hypothetical protein
MLAARRLAGLFALEAYYAGVRARAQSEADRWGRGPIEAEFSPSKVEGLHPPDLAVLARPAAASPPSCPGSRRDRRWGSPAEPFRSEGSRRMRGADVARVAGPLYAPPPLAAHLYAA